MPRIPYRSLIAAVDKVSSSRYHLSSGVHHQLTVSTAVLEGTICPHKEMFVYRFYFIFFLHRLGHASHTNTSLFSLAPCKICSAVGVDRLGDLWQSLLLASATPFVHSFADLAGWPGLAGVLARTRWQVLVTGPHYGPATSPLSPATAYYSKGEIYILGV